MINTVLIAIVAIEVPIACVVITRQMQWLRMVLIPWIVAINTKLGLPK